MKKIIAITLGLLALGCKNESTTSEETTQDTGYVTVSQQQFNTMGMVVSTPLIKDFDVTIKASGRIDVPPKNRAKITTYIGGFVKSSKPVDRG